MKFNYKSYLLGVVTATILSIHMDNWLGPKEIPSGDKVQEGFIAPGKLEIKCKDLDKDGEPETIMKIGNQQYLLREVDGKPVLSLYDVEPAKIQYLE